MRLRRVRSVVGNVYDDGKARSATHAVDKRITKSLVVFVESFAQAIVANADVGRNERAFRFPNFAFDNAKTGFARSRDFFDFDRGNARRRRGFSPKCF